VTSILGAVSVARDAAKQTGRNRVHVYEQADIDLLRRRGEFQWVGKIQSALTAGRFDLFAQPITPLVAEDRVPHFEVLVRMRDDHGQLVPPAKFLPAAEHYQLMPGIDRWVVGKAVDRLLATSELCGDEPPMRLSVNISGQSLSDEPFMAFLGEQLERLDAKAGHLCFDISESAVVASTNDALAFIKVVKDPGCRVSLDNVGSGLSSFASLQKIDVDYLKIDGAYVRHVDTDREAATMVSAINQVGHALGLQTIAEFAENGKIVSKISEIGVDFAQGYHFGRPQPLGELVGRLTQTRFAVNG
jgi:Amt family ammonium transporter